jgi:colanic acid/amylovoran biosynthesis glycosyltransferase
MRVCYFVSEYPAVSHTFIRREIIELERDSKGDMTVMRVSLRRNAREVVDQADVAEKECTRYILNESLLTFARALAAAVLCRPKAFFASVRGAARMMRRSHRPMLFHVAYLAEALVLAAWLREQGIHHIHAHFGTNGAEVAMLAHLLTGIPYSFTVHGPDEFDRPEYLGLAEKVRHAAFVCAVSCFTRAQLYRWIPSTQWGKVKLVKCGVDADFLASHHFSRPSKHELVSIGRLSGQKGQLVLLHALAELEREGVPFKMTIIGDGPLRPVLEQRVRELGLQDKVAIPGWLSNSEVRSQILSARAVVLPSFAEGLPVVLMEALALGRPVIATCVAGIPELVTDGVCGWLVPAGSVEHLSGAIRACMRESDQRIQALGRAGRERVLEMHNIVGECRKLARFFRDPETAASLLEGSTAGATDQIFLEKLRRNPLSAPLLADAVPLCPDLPPPRAGEA